MTTKRIPVPEKSIMQACIGWLTYHRILCWRANSGTMKQPNADGSTRYIAFSSAKGMSDICAILPSGRFAAIEVKSASGELSKDQREFLQRVAAAGGLAITVRSVEDLEAAITPILRERKSA